MIENTSEQIENYKLQIEKITSESNETSANLEEIDEEKSTKMTKKSNDELVMLKTEHERIVNELKKHHDDQLKAANSFNTHLRILTLFL